MNSSARRLLVLSVGYGQGHHSAAAALAEYYGGQGWQTRIADVCEMASPRAFRVTQLFYQLCVRRAPWLWGITYALTATADWRLLVQTPFFASVLKELRKLLHEDSPDLIICTYPLFAYMLDELRARHENVAPYVVMVTDSLEISRPWMKSDASLVLVPDEYSAQMMKERYALAEDRVVSTGFPVKKAFVPLLTRREPGEESLRILYGAYRQTQGVVDDITAILRAFPQSRVTVLAGRRAMMLRREFAASGILDRLWILSHTDSMAELLPKYHFYIGKAGAATMFECYAAGVPMLVNYTLPGQEQGNLQLLLHDGAGCHVQSTAHLLDSINRLLRDNAAGWKRMRLVMNKAGRTNGAERAACEIYKRLGL